jgi:hypothetical protein
VPERCNDLLISRMRIRGGLMRRKEPLIVV